jgi:hypothetical protein
MANDPNALRSIVKWSVFLFAALLIFYLAAGVWAAIAHNNEQRALAVDLLQSMDRFGAAAWHFVRPLLQLAIVLMIIDWLLRRLGIQLSAGARGFDWNVQAIIAIVVVAAFAIAELSGIGGAGLKDVVLVVVGFYFGTQRRVFEVDPGTGQIRHIEEHDNPVSLKQDSAPPKKADDSHA